MNHSTVKQDKLKHSADVVIVGGGIIGLSVARELALRGVCDVALLERGQLGAEASWAAGGILAPQVEADYADEFFRLACASRDMYPAFANMLHEETGIDVELERTGTLFLGFTSHEEQEMRRRCDWQTSEGLSIEWLTPDEARRLEPNISPHVRCALRFPNDYQVENRRVIDALVLANQRLGVRLATNCEVSSLRIENEMIRGAETSNGFVAARVVVLAAGAWTSQITPPGTTCSEIKIEPVRGQMLCFAAPQIVRQVTYSSRGYLIPRRDGRLLAGSTSERVGFDKRVTHDGVNSIKSMAFEIAPALERLPLIDSWAGFRPRANDDLPVLGPDEEVEGLFYTTGHYRNGILLAPITAALIADSIVNRAESSLLESFSPSRFRTVAAGL
jgi:glycine oxidase